MNPIISIIVNHSAGTFHPVVFVESPLPGGAGPVRHKSKMHHTGGFASREAAIENVRTDLAARVSAHFGPVREAFVRDFDWDGADVPALVAFFAETPAGLIPAF